MMDIFFFFFYEYTYLRIISHRLLHELLKERLRKQVTNKLNLYYSFPLFFIFVIWYYNTKFLLFQILSPYGMPKYVCRKKGFLFYVNRIMNVGSRCNDVCYPFVCCTIDSAFKTHNYERRE